MTVSSMTGFARAAGDQGVHSWIWEARSVNGKGLDVRCRLPVGVEVLETEVRAAAAKRFARGSVSLTLTTKRASGALDVSINQDFLERLGQITKQVADHLNVEPPRLDGLLAVKGVLDFSEPEEGDAEKEALKLAMMVSLEQVLDQLAEARDAEGERTDGVLRGHISDLDALIGQSRNTAATQPEAQRARLKQRVDALLEAVPSLAEDGLAEDRLAQEVALLITRADVTEELDRLSAHVVAARELLDGKGSVGRKLEFLSQEFNREANTLCSKSADMELTRIGLELKSVIDRFREQVANIE